MNITGSWVLKNGCAMKIFFVIGISDGLNANQISEKAGVPYSTTVRRLERMIEDGLIEYEENSGDRKSRIYRLARQIVVNDLESHPSSTQLAGDKNGDCFTASDAGMGSNHGEDSGDARVLLLDSDYFNSKNNNDEEELALQAKIILEHFEESFFNRNSFRWHGKGEKFLSKFVELLREPGITVTLLSHAISAFLECDEDWIKIHNLELFFSPIHLDRWLSDGRKRAVNEETKDNNRLQREHRQELHELADGLNLHYLKRYGSGSNSGISDHYLDLSNLLKTGYTVNEVTFAYREYINDDKHAAMQHSFVEFLQLKNGYLPTILNKRVESRPV